MKEKASGIKLKSSIIYRSVKIFVVVWLRGAANLSHSKKQAQDGVTFIRHVLKKIVPPFMIHTPHDSYAQIDGPITLTQGDSCTVKLYDTAGDGW
jgi:hypothetical protein